MDLRTLSRSDLEALFEERKRALIAVRDEIDRRDRDGGLPGVEVDFTKLVDDYDSQD